MGRKEHGSEGDPRGVRHKTLSAYYPHIYTLRDFLIQSISDVQLAFPTDPVEYHELLSNTICASRYPIPKVPSTELGQTHGTQQEAIDRILRELGRQGRSAGEGMNILLAGNRNPISDLAINAHRPQMENRHANSPSSVLRSLPWKILRSRLGDAGFRHLLIFTSLYLPIGNNCHMQLSGSPVYDLYDHVKHVSPIQYERYKRKLECTEKHLKPRKKRRKKKDIVSQDGNISTGKKRESPAEISIARQKMFYGRPARGPSGRLIDGLPPDHILNRLSRSKQRAEDRSCILLLQDVFPQFLGHSASFSDGRSSEIDALPEIPKTPGCVRRIPVMLGAMREMLIRHGQTDYGCHLRRCIDHSIEPEVLHVLNDTPLAARDLITQSLGSSRSSQSEDGSKLFHKPAIVECLSTSPGLNSVSHGQVCRFVTTVLRSLLSIYIVGSQHNLDVIIRNSRVFVQAKQHEAINLHSLIQDIRVNDISWLSTDDMSRVSAQEMSKKRKLVEELMYWIFSNLLVPLLKNSFYITETAITRYETIYYSHRAWAEATDPHFRKLEETLLEPVGNHVKHPALQGPLGVSAVRLIPKPEGFRPIVNLGRRIKPQNIPGMPVLSTAKTTTANQVLRGIHQVLTYEKDRKRESLGSSLFGTNEIFTPLQALKQEVKSIHGKLPRMYFVKMDIKAAFDTIKQDKMLEVIEMILDKNHDYCLLLYCLLLPPASKASQGSARRLFKSRAIVNDDLSSTFGDHAKEIAAPLRNAVVVDLVRRRQITRDACMNLLRTHIKNNVWQVQDNYFRQKTGIPQGSKLSSLLCSFFYACMEAEHLSWVNKAGSRLLRYIDDFLLVTDDYHLAKRFVGVMQKGFPEYGAFISPSKTLLSFEYATGSQVAPVVVLQEDERAYFPYCGFFIDMKSLDLSLDWPRTLVAPVRQTFALRNRRHRGQAFVGWLSRQLENRNHVAYLDTLHNDPSTVHCNIFLNFALTAMKIPYYFEQPTARTETSSGRLTVQQAHVVFDSISLSAEYTYIAGRARVFHAARSDHNRMKEHYTISKTLFVYLALSAIQRVLEKKRNRYGRVVELIEGFLSQREFRGYARRHGDITERGWRVIKDVQY